MERCLDEKQCPLDRLVIQNLKFLIGLRHEIEHQMTTRIDDLLSSRFQACCINYHEAIVAIFGESYGIADHLAVSLQFASIGREQVTSLREIAGLPPNIISFIEGFDGSISSEDYNSPKFAYRVIFVPRTVNHPNQADQAITFVNADSEIAKGVNAHYTVIKETERPKLLPSEVVKLMKSEGFVRFHMQQHTELWQAMKAKDTQKKYGVKLANTWYWYESWVEVVRSHCSEGDYR